MVGAPGVQRSIGLHTNPVITSSARCRLTIQWCQMSKPTRKIAHLCKIKGSQILYVPPTLSVFLENKLCYICKKTLFQFSSRFDIWHHGIVNLQQAEEFLTGIVRKPMLRWTPGVFITPGTYHIFVCYAYGGKIP